MASPVKADIELLFGVLGGGEISGQSGIRIKSEIDSIVAKLNTTKEVNNRGILFTLNRTKSREKIVTGIQQICKDFDGQKQFQNKFGVNLTVKKIDASTAIAKFRSDLEAMLNNLRIDTGFDVKADDSGATSATQQAAQAARDRAGAEREAADAINQRKAAEGSASRKTEEATVSQKKITDLLSSTSSLLGRVQNAEANWTSAKFGTKAGEYSKLSGIIDELKRQYDALGKAEYAASKSGSFSKTKYDEMAATVSRLRSEFSAVERNIKLAGENTKTFTQRIGGLSEKFSTWLGVSQVIMQIIRALKKMVSTAIEVDTAMTELLKVTDETQDRYIEFLETATDRAKKLGATIADTVSASADFARLGYNLDEAAELADAAIVYQNVGDGIKDIGTASESIISTMKAFGMEAEHAMLIVDKFNITGNKFAITSAGVGDALLNSASSLAAANNSLDQSIAMITAANNVIQNPEKVGTALKTVSMFLRAAKTEAEAAGESTDGMASSVSELRSELLALTGGKVDIQIDENNFKSTYDIIRELALVWEDLTDVTQANILEMIGGKRNSNVVAALISNFETAKDVMNEVGNAAGSALEENEKYLDSIEGHITLFKAAFEELSLVAVDSEFVKDIVDLGTSLINFLTWLTEIIDKIGGIQTVVTYLGARFVGNNINGWLSSLGKKLPALTDVINILTKSFRGVGTSGSTALSLIQTSATGATGAVTGLATALSVAQVAVLALTVVFGVIIPLIQEWHKTTEELIEEYKDLEAEVSSLNSELKTAEDRIDELLSKDTLTIVEKEELDTLIKTNNQLERQIKVKERLAQLAARESNAALLDDYENESFELSDDASYGLHDAIFSKANELYNTAYNSELIDWANSGNFAAIEKKFGSEAISTAQALAEEYNNLIGLAGDFAQNGYSFESAEEYFNFLSTEYNQLRDNLGNLTSEEYEAMLVLEGELASLMTTLDEDYLGRYVGSDENTEAWQALSDSIYHCLEPAAYFTEQMSTLSNTTQQMLLSAADSGFVTAEYIESLAAKSAELAHWMTELGYSAQDVANILSMPDSSEYSLKNLQDAKKFFYQLLDEEGYNELSSMSNDQIISMYLAIKDEGVFDNGEQIVSIQEVLDFLDTLNKKAKDTYTFKTAVSGIGEVESGLKAITGAYAEFAENGAVSASSLSKLYDDLAGFDLDGLDDFVAVLGNSNSSIADVQTAVKSLATEMLASSKVIKDTSGEYDGLIQSTLKLAGVTNSAEIVKTNRAIPNNIKLAGSIQAINGATKDEIDATWMSIEATLIAEGVEDDAIETYKDLYYKKFDNTTVTAAMVEEYLKEAAAAGVANEETKRLAEAVTFLSQAETAEAQAAALREQIALRPDWMTADMAMSIEARAKQLDEEAAGLRDQFNEVLNKPFDVNEKEVHDRVEGTVTAVIGGLQDALKKAGGLLPEFDWGALLGEDKDAEKYVAVLEPFRKTLEELDDIRRNISDTEFAIETTDPKDTERLVELHNALAGYYDQEATKLRELNSLNDDLIEQKLTDLETKYGIKATYKADTDDLEFTNLEEILGKLSGDEAKAAEEAYKEVESLVSANVDLESSARDAVLSMNSENNAIAELSKPVEDATVEIERYRKELYDLSKIQLSGERLDMAIDAEEDPEERARLIKKRIGLYKDEQDAHHALAEARRADIEANLKELEGHGIKYTYDSANNDLFIENMEDIENLAPDVQEAVLELAEGTIELNDANKESSSSWWDLNYAIGDAKVNIVDALKEITSAASEAVDTIQGVYDTLHSAADEFAANGGFITVDTFQSILDLGPQYMQYLKDENGLLTINEEKIQAVIAAKTEQLAIDSAMSYVKRLEAVLNGDSTESLEELLTATRNLNQETWVGVYAKLADLNLTREQRKAAEHNIDMYKKLAANAASSIGKTAGAYSDQLESMKTGMDDILQYTMDMIKHQIEEQIDTIEDMKDAFSEYIDMQKESLDQEKENADYKKTVANKVKEIAKIQSQLDALAMDDSREAQAERVKLQEELAELQEDLSETQNEKAIEAQKEALDKMNEDYAESKDKEIQEFEDAISSEEKLHDLAINHIKTNWDSLYDELITWNFQHGSLLETEITSAWGECLKAAQRYGDYLTALDKLEADIQSASGNSDNYNVGGTQTYNQVRDLVAKMQALSLRWRSASNDERESIYDERDEYVRQLAELGVKASLANSGHWYIDSDSLDPSNAGELLYDAYGTAITYNDPKAERTGLVEQMRVLSKKWHNASNSERETIYDTRDGIVAQLEAMGLKLRFDPSTGQWYIVSDSLNSKNNGKLLYDVYHTGGIVGGAGSMKENELLAKLEEGEAVISNKNKGNLYSLIDFVTMLSKKLDLSGFMAKTDLPKTNGRALDNMIGSKQVNITLGDVIIQGNADQATVAKHAQVNRDMVNQIARVLNIKL